VLDGSAVDAERDIKAAKASAGAGHSVDLSAVTHRFGNFVAVDDVSLSVKAGEVLALLGPSGCGKTTLLRIISGFIEQTAGSVLIDGRSIDHLPPNLRRVGIVFQSYALFPHMTVAENVAYGLKARGTPRAGIKPRVSELLETVQLEAMPSACRANFPAASSSVSRLPAPLPSSPPSCCSMNLSAHSTRTCASTCRSS
jgi:ABC-type sugar transport system ATPase subunit